MEILRVDGGKTGDFKLIRGNFLWVGCKVQLDELASLLSAREVRKFPKSQFLATSWGVQKISDQLV